MKALATDIQAAQDPEIASMNAWLSEWKAAPTATGGTGGMDHGGGTTEPG